MGVNSAIDAYNVVARVKNGLDPLMKATHDVQFGRTGKALVSFDGLETSL